MLILKEALDKVNYMDPEVNAYVSEAVIGRRDISQRDGMILRAYDSGDKQIAKELLQFVLNLVTCIPVIHN